MGRGIMVLAVLAALTLLSTWFLSTVQSSLRQSAPATAVPTLYMDRFLATRMSEQGVRQYTVAAPHLVQLAADQGTRIDSPDINVFLEDGQVREWLIRAGTGWMSADNSLIRLQDQVTITRPADSGQLPLVMVTDHLQVQPAQNLIETDAPVRMTTPGGIIEAVGLKADLNSNRLELLNQVRGRYEPPQS